MKEIDIGKYQEVKILAGSHNKIIIEKLYGPTIEEDLIIEWGDYGWNIIHKQKVKEVIDKIHKMIDLNDTGSEDFDVVFTDELKKELGLTAEGKE